MTQNNSPSESLAQAAEHLGLTGLESIRNNSALTGKIVWPDGSADDIEVFSARDGNGGIVLLVDFSSVAPQEPESI